MTSGAWLKQIREQSGLTQCELAGVFDISGQFISLIESGSRPVPVDWALLLKIIFGVSSEKFFSVLENEWRESIALKMKPPTAKQVSRAYKLRSKIKKSAAIKPVDTIGDTHAN